MSGNDLSVLLGEKKSKKSLFDGGDESISATTVKRSAMLASHQLRWKGNYIEAVKVSLKKQQHQKKSQQHNLSPKQVAASASPSNQQQQQHHHQQQPRNSSEHDHHNKKKGLWFRDEKTGKWIRRDHPENINNSNQQRKHQQNNNTHNWSFSEKEFQTVVQRINASVTNENDKFKLDLFETTKLFRMVQVFGSKFEVIADRWNVFGGGAGNDDDEDVAEESSPSSLLLYRHFCIFIAVLGEIRREALKLVLEAKMSDKNNKKKKNNEITNSTNEEKHVQVATALLREHPYLKHFLGANNSNNSKFHIPTVDELQQREKFLAEKYRDISSEDVLGNEFSERIHELQNQSAVLSAKCEVKDRNVPHDISDTNLEAEKAAANTVLFAEQQRYFKFAPGSVRSAIDDFVFLDLPATGSGAVKQHKDLEDFLERHLQCFVPAANVEVMKRIDALRAVVAATTVLEKETSRVKSSTVAMSKLTESAERLRLEVLENSVTLLSSTGNNENSVVKKEEEVEEDDDDKNSSSEMLLMSLQRSGTRRPRE